MSIRYVYAVKTGRGKGPKAFEQREVPASLVDASTELTEAVEARLAGKLHVYPNGFEDLNDEDVASIFAAHKRRELELSGGRFTRVPTVWSARSESRSRLRR